MSQINWNMLLWFVPLLIGGIVAAINKDPVNTMTEGIEARFRGWQRKAAERDGFLFRYILNPLLWTIVKFFDWTDGFSHRGLKNGVRVATTLYLIALWLLLLYSAILIAIMVAAALVVLFIVGKVLSGPSDDSEVRYSSSRRVANDEDDEAPTIVGPRGTRMYAGSNWFTEELRGRVDDEGNIYSGTNWLTEEKIGRIDDEGNIYKGTSVFSEDKVGRIDEDGTLYKGSNWFTEEKTGRIDKDGTIFKGTNWFNEEKTGRTGE
jgi:hypothetical protein